MTFEALIALLLPLAAASGWFSAKRHFSQKHQDQMAPLTRAYRQGLNYLLDEKTDKAIAAVDQVLQHDKETFETQIVLGNLFRRRGEVERAIDIHTRLQNADGLNAPERARAAFELGLDFMRAGLFDRAESLFLSLKDTASHGIAAMQQLLQIYQQQRDWTKAIDIILPLRKVVKPRHGETAAHFFCELAEASMAHHRAKDARDFLAEALKDDPGCVRATITRGRLEIANGEYRQALETFRVLEGQDPLYLPVVLPLIQQCSDKLGLERELIDYLDRLYQDYGMVSAAVERAERLKDRQGSQSAVEYLLPILEKTPDALAISRALKLVADGTGSVSSKIRKLCQLLIDNAGDRPLFVCEHCGFGTSELFWHCPSCKHWGSIRPTGPFSTLTLLEEDRELPTRSRS